MSKSKNNFINIFLPDKKLRKQVMTIATDSTPLEEPKNPDTCNVFALYKLLGTESQIAELRKKYLAGNFGYGHAKQELFELIIDKYSVERERFNYFMENPEEVDRLLKIGEEKARKIAAKVLKRVREKLGY